MYLARSVEEFHHAGSPRHLWVEVPDYYGDSLLEPVQRRYTACNRRLHFLRSAMLFCAVAVEAFANELLDELVSRSEAEALDRLTPPDKILVGLRMSGQDLALERGGWPMNELLALNKLRSKLVHPKPQGGLAAWVRDLDEAAEVALGPAAVKRAILAACDAMVACNSIRKHPILHEGLAKQLSKQRAVFDAHLAGMGREIVDVPSENAPEPPDLVNAARGRAAGRPTRFAGS